jgi:Holliday junction resolvase RusA-like endonuclease
MPWRAAEGGNHMTPIITVTLPWPDADLSPNSRKHWNKIKAVTVARNLAYVEARNQRGNVPFPSPQRLSVRMDFYPPDSRHRDLDNMIAMVKSFQDGIFEAIGLNDHMIVALVALRGACIKGGKVTIAIESEEK